MNYYYPALLDNYYEKPQLFYPVQRQDSNNHQFRGMCLDTVKSVAVNEQRMTVRVNTGNEFQSGQHKKYCPRKKTERGSIYYQKNTEDKLCDSPLREDISSLNESPKTEDIKMSR